MELSPHILNRLVPITQFNRGQASRIFDRLQNEPELVILKNNQPSAIILSPEEYTRLSEIEENYLLLLEATKRMKKSKGKKALSVTEVFERLNISANELDDVEDPEIE